jgi:hypothetical protein
MSKLRSVSKAGDLMDLGVEMLGELSRPECRYAVYLCVLFYMLVGFLVIEQSLTTYRSAAWLL